MAPIEGSFRHAGHRLTYDIHGEGENVIVLVHGLLMNRRMYERLAPELAARGNRVITLDLLGHGRSDRPVDPRLYNMTAFSEQVLSLLDHLGLEAPVIGGTSLGANVGLEFATRHPERAGGLFIEMPVLDNALLGAVLIFTPMLLVLRFGQPVLRLVRGRGARASRARSASSTWASTGSGRTRSPHAPCWRGSCSAAPHLRATERQQLRMPALVIGHPSDPLHPFSDADMVADEMPNARLVDANSILEWRLNPGRLDDELSDFLKQVTAAAEPDERLRVA